MLSVIENENILVNEEPIDCNGLPEYIGFGVSETDGFSIDANIDNIEIKGEPLEESD